ncbi:MAG: HEAT repeat domain-containing protein [Phenylobacterium sp.]
MPLIRSNSGAVPPPPAAPSSALRDGATDARWSAARSLTAAGDVPALGAALTTETDPRVREAILTSLARIGDAAAAEAVLPHIRSDDADVRTAALDSLRAMPGGAAASLPGLLADPDADVRLLACEVVRALPQAGATQLLCELIEREPEANVCAAAIDVLAEVGGAEALPALASCAARFAAEPFLGFAIRVATERIRAGDRLA